jgi:hypothetical protein
MHISNHSPGQCTRISVSATSGKYLISPQVFSLHEVKHELAETRPWFCRQLGNDWDVCPAWLSPHVMGDDAGGRLCLYRGKHRANDLERAGTATV